ncbi:hypothetical protein GCM10023220_64620 [Streptomyces ziwulingensis]|uniref:Uncharacterized protein n=1 Tax=Streptomyces ziwulingensis TaxID=1045501 RepID=A0ABP9D280_9ACTN
MPGREQRGPGQDTRGAAPPSDAAPRSPLPRPRTVVYSAGSTDGSVPVFAARPYHRALDFGVRSRVT